MPEKARIVNPGGIEDTSFLELNSNDEPVNKEPNTIPVEDFPQEDARSKTQYREE